MTVWQETTSLFTAQGQRKYLTRAEAMRFLDTAGEFDLPTAALACLVACSGCRLSEALQLTRFQLDPASSAVVFRTLKRRRLHHRSVPVPSEVIDILLALSERDPTDSRLWQWSRQHGWRRIKAVMAAAGIEGPHANPKGLRHAYGVACATARIDPRVTQRMMGHSKPATTAIYLEVMGPEAFALLSRMWHEQWGLASAGQ